MSAFLNVIVGLLVAGSIGAIISFHDFVLVWMPAFLFGLVLGRALYKGRAA